MKIELTISTHNLGDCNTTDDNQRYATTVEAAIQAEYPEADVSVELIENVTSGSCFVSDDPRGEIEENVHIIANKIWDKADY